MSLSEDFVAMMPKLGFGLMRLPMVNDRIDIPQTTRMVDLFMEAGFKYFDTAYAYGNGASEQAIKIALVDRYPRDSFFLASKLAAWAGANNAVEAKGMFYTSLERTGAGYFDFFLLHHLGESRTRVFDDFGIWDFLAEQKEKGLIHQLGFSFHDKADVLERILEAHPDIDFVQLQINYLDWESNTVQSRLCWETARHHNKPIVVMEPVKGGNLAIPPDSVKALFSAVEPGLSPSGWALRFAASREGVLTVLSGMSNIAQMKENIATMANYVPMNDSEELLFERACELINQIPSIQCTGCEYCLKGCPKHIAIPPIFRVVNTYKRFGSMDWARDEYEWETKGHGLGNASECIGCGRCERVCPQHLAIREELKKAAEMLE